MGLVIRTDLFNKTQHMEAGNRWLSMVFSSSSSTSTRITMVHLQPRSQYDIYIALLLQMQGMHRDDESTVRVLVVDFNARLSQAEFRSLHEARPERFAEKTYHIVADQRGHWLADRLRS